MSRFIAAPCKLLLFFNIYETTFKRIFFAKIFLNSVLGRLKQNILVCNILNELLVTHRKIYTYVCVYVNSNMWEMFQSQALLTTQGRFRFKRTNLHEKILS